MLHPIKLQIRKKTLVPTRRQRSHMFRSDWIPVAYIEYEMSRSVFKNVAPGNGLIETDAQFVKLVRDNYGDGEYSVMAWKIGRKGFWPFLQFVVKGNMFHRVEPKMTSEMKEAKEHSREYNRLSKELMSATNASEQNSIVEEMNEKEEMMSLNKEIVNLSKSNRKGPYPYLKSSQPIYREHEVEEYKKINKGEVVEYDRGMNSIW